MLQTIVCPNVGHSIVHHFDEGAAAWGRALTPSIAHLLQCQLELSIDYTRVRPGIVFDTHKGGASLPHIIDTSTFRLEADIGAFRHAVGQPGASVDASITIDVGPDCLLKFWGSVALAVPIASWNRAMIGDGGAAQTIPVHFTLAFWEISHALDSRHERIMRKVAEKDQRIRELEDRLAMSMCSQ